MMNEYPPQSNDHRELHEDDVELAASLRAIEERLGIVATEGQVAMTAEAHKDTRRLSGSRGTEDIDNVLDAAYGINQAYNAIIDEGDKVYDEAARMNEEYKAKQTVELRQLIDEALTELRQADDGAKPEQAANERSEIKTGADSRKAEPSADDRETAKATTPLVMNPAYTEAVLARTDIAKPLPGQASVDSTTGEVVVTNVLNENSLTVIQPQIGGEPTVTTYNLDPNGGKLTITNNGVTSEAVIAPETDDIALGRQRIKLPPSVAKFVGAEFVLAA